jgi:hypothetical protein
MWFRVFGTNGRQPEPAALLDHLQAHGFTVSGRFRGDDQGWFQVELWFGPDAPLLLSCYRAEEEGLRAELNTWAAWLETVEDNPHHGPLMRHVIGTTQLFALELPADHPQVGPLYLACVALCRYLARETAGVYQADGEGFANADGELLLRED